MLLVSVAKQGPCQRSLKRKSASSAISQTVWAGLRGAPTEKERKRKYDGQPKGNNWRRKSRKIRWQNLIEYFSFPLFQYPSCFPNHFLIKKILAIFYFFTMVWLHSLNEVLSRKNKISCVMQSECVEKYSTLTNLVAPASLEFELFLRPCCADGHDHDRKTVASVMPSSRY